MDSAVLVWMFFIWHVPLKSYSKFSAVLEIWLKIAFETNFCKFDPCNDHIRQFLPLHNVYLAEMRILSYQASWYVHHVSRYARKRSSRKSPLTAPKWGVLGDNSSMGWDVSMRPLKAHPWPEPRRLMYNIWAQALGAGCGLAQQVTRKKYSANRKLRLYGEPRPPADHYELRATWRCRQHKSILQIFALIG
jgi:hypothetical protein